MTGFMPINMRSHKNYGDWRNLLRNDTFRLLSNYDLDNNSRISYSGASLFFKDSFSKDPERETEILFEQDKKKDLTFDQVYKYLLAQLKRNIPVIDQELLTFLQSYHNPKEKISFKEIESFLKTNRNCYANARLGALYIVLLINGNDDTFKVSVEDLKKYVNVSLCQYKKFNKMQMEKEFDKEVRNASNTYPSGYPIQ